MQNKYPIINFVFQHKNINLPIIIVVTIILIIVVFFVMPLEYTADVSVLPSAASFTSGLAGSIGNLGKFAGINLTGTPAQSQEMYIGIINSKRLLDQVIYHEYKFFHKKDTLVSNLIDFLEIDADTRREVTEKVLKNMRNDVIDTKIDVENDILYLSVTTENPFLSALVANRIVYILNDIVKKEVQKEFHQKQEYLQSRLAEIEDSLKIAEHALERFLELNSNPTLPSFQIEQLRLQRDLRLQTELLIEFRKQLEIFIADNMINLANIKILDEAFPPYRKSRPKRALLLITFTFLAIVIQVAINASILMYGNLKRELSGVPIDQRKNI